MNEQPRPKQQSAKSQVETIKTYIGQGRWLTPLIAMTNLGIMSLTSRISQLRKRLEREGDEYRVAAIWHTDTNGKPYKSYTMVPRPSDGWPSNDTKDAGV